jgi:glycine cleavage system regulatory protein
MSPLQLAESPELAALELLAQAISIARAALVAVHLEMQEGDFAAALVVSGSLQACCADGVITNLDALATALELYREVLDQTQRR